MLAQLLGRAAHEECLKDINCSLFAVLQLSASILGAGRHADMLGNKKNLEAKHEKIIKDLLRLGDNRRCVDCDSIVSMVPMIGLSNVDSAFIVLLLFKTVCSSAGTAIRCINF